MKKAGKIMTAILLLVMLVSGTVRADDTVNTPYVSYTYNEEHSQAIMTPAPYRIDVTITGEGLGIGDFNSVTDVTVDEETGYIYLTDAGNNRIVVLNSDHTLHTVLKEFINDGTTDSLLNPYAVFIKDTVLYVADTDHNRIVIFQKDTYEFVREIRQPEIKLLGDYTFLPKSFAVDLAGRIYVIAQNINEGIVQLDAEGTFERFVGAPDVTLSWGEKLWKMIMTDAQKAQLEKAVPTEYNGIDIDEDGFLYLTSQDTTVNPITKLNCQGDNILRVNTMYTPCGDTGYYHNCSLNKAAQFVDISVRGDGVYAALDSSVGKVFVYDQEGVLLYCFGTNGAQEGTFRSAAAVALSGDKLLVADQSGNTLTIFTETEFGVAVDQAVTHMLNGKYSESAEYWTRVLEMCPAYDYAYRSLARTDIQAKDYKTALNRLKGQSSYGYYYEAFEGVRKEVISDNFTLIFIGVFAAAFLLILCGRLWKKHKVSQKLNRYKLVQELKFARHTMFHPIDGFWDLKREHRGSLRAANVFTAAFVFLYGLRAQASGYCFTHQLPADIDVIFEVLKMVLPLAMWIVSNWCFTSLMDGKGTMKDIYIATAYALRPYIITAVPMLILSHCLSGNEAFIYNTADGIIMIWMIGLIFFGMMVTHEYSLGKGILTAVLTLVGICLMIFLALVCFHVLQDMFTYGTEIYQEIMYRTY